MLTRACIDDVIAFCRQYFEPSLDYLATRDGWGELVRRLALLGVRGAGRAPRVNLKRPTPSKYSEIVSKDVKKFELFIGKQAGRRGKPSYRDSARGH